MMIPSSTQPARNHNQSTIQGHDIKSPQQISLAQTDLATYGVDTSTNPTDIFSYPCAECERMEWCRENRACQAFMQYRLMAVFTDDRS